MSSAFENLCGPGKPLKAEPADAAEFAGLVESGRERLRDAAAPGLGLISRFDLAYNGVHALCLAALRWHGYRSTNRYIVFQLLPHTLELGPEVWRVLAKCHDERNRAEYEGMGSIDKRLFDELMLAGERVAERVEALEHLELYSPERKREFDKAEAELAELFARKSIAPKSETAQGLTRHTNKKLKR